MADVAGAASVLYAPALAEVIGYELIPDKPRVRGGILVTFRDECGALVTIRLLHKALGNLLRALEAGAVVRIPDAESKPLPSAIDVQPFVEVMPPHQAKISSAPSGS